MKLTPWYPPEINPVHSGVYQTRLAGLQYSKDEFVYSWWKDEKWYWNKNDFHSIVFKDRKWRGLASKPKEKP